MTPHPSVRHGWGTDTLRQELERISRHLDRAVAGEAVGELTTQLNDPLLQRVCHQLGALLAGHGAEADAVPPSPAVATAEGRFLTNMSHEVRTPMSAVLDTNALLLGTELNPQQRELAEAVQDSARALWRVVNNVLDLAQVAAGRSGLTLDLADFDLPDLLARTVRTWADTAREKGLSLTLEVDPRLPQMMHGDAGRLRQVLLNLLNNAVKFTEKGRVGVSARPTQDGLRVEVSDTGIGIPPGAAARLFRRFEQADPSIARRFGGTGLGLAISKELVELMGGQIDFKSTPGIGSVFRFDVKLGRAFSVTGSGTAAQARLL